MNFWRMILVFFLIQVVIGTLFRYLGLPFQIAELVITFIISFVYAFYFHRLDSIVWYKNVALHKTFAITFIILITINLLFVVL